jgi:ATP adenylyltransferase
VTNERLWAPWRLEYVADLKKEPAAACFLCRSRDESHHDENLVVARGDRSLVVLNRFPYNNGHLLVVPADHKAELGELDDEELLDCQRWLQRCVTALTKIMTPDGFNIGLNLGRAAGAGVPGHLHWHIVPRWKGDVNFMPVLADTKVIPQSLDALFELLTPELVTTNDL